VAKQADMVWGIVAWQLRNLRSSWPAANVGGWPAAGYSLGADGTSASGRSCLNDDVSRGQKFRVTAHGTLANYAFRSEETRDHGVSSPLHLLPLCGFGAVVRLPCSFVSARFWLQATMMGPGFPCGE